MFKTENKTNIEGFSRKIFYKLFIAQFVLLAIFVFVFCGNVYFHKRSTAKQVSEIISTFIINEQKRDMANALSSVTTSNFSAVAYIDENGDNLLNFPPKESDRHPSKGNFLERTFTSQFSVEIIPKDSEHSKGRLIFSFNIFDTIYLSLLCWAFLTFMLIPLVKRFRSLLNSEIEKSALSREKMAISQAIKEVWHDIGQPLQVLRALQENSTSMAKNEKEKISSSCEDITQIVEQLKGIEDPYEIYQLLPLVESIFETEKVKYQNKNISFSLSVDESPLAYFSKIQKTSFKRIIGNLVDNSVKSLSPNGGEIQLSLSSQGDFIEIHIKDNGEGIRAENLPFVGTPGKSFRADGNGIGLSSSISKVKSWGGDLQIDSTFGTETTVTIKLQKSSTPEWAIIKKINRGYDYLAVIDDRKDIYELIRSKVNLQGLFQEVEYFNNPSNVRSWLELNGIDKDKVFFICDYDLGSNLPKGTSIIKSLDILRNSVLLTNHYEDFGVQSNCESLGIKMAPKISLNRVLEGLQISSL